MLHPLSVETQRGQELMPLGLKVCSSAPQHPPPSVRQLRGGTVYTISRSFLMELSSIWPLWEPAWKRSLSPFRPSKTHFLSGVSWDGQQSTSVYTLVSGYPMESKPRQRDP